MLFAGSAKEGGIYYWGSMGTLCRRIKGSSSSNTGVPAAGRSCAYGWQLGSLENKGMEMCEIGRKLGAKEYDWS